MRLPREVRLVEVGPRDGLQNEPKTLSVALRAALIERLVGAGLRVVEAGAFVSPRRVPQMAGTADVLARLPRTHGVSYPVLVPNLRGLQDALAAGAQDIAVFAAASETFSQRNLKRSIDASLDEYARVCAEAAHAGVRVRGYVSCALVCPFEGPVAPAAVARVAVTLTALGCYEISLGDTIGAGTPRQARDMVDAVAKQVPCGMLAVHFHDTYGQALANILAVMERGVAVIDSSVAGLGGCPFAPGAAGNVASEDVLYMLNGLGIRTGVDLKALVAAGAFACSALGRESGSKAGRALERNEQK